MKINKKTAAVSLMLTLSLLFTGCGDNKENNNRKESVELSAEKTDNAVNNEEKEPEIKNISLVFAGDINLDDTWPTMVYLHENGDDIEKAIDPDYLSIMKNADLLYSNNEFTYTTSDSALPGKTYTFKANPENLHYLTDLGVDMYGLANNHVWDYGKEGFLDTLDCLEAGDNPYVGAGRNINEAKAPKYLTVDGIKIAYVAASRAEKNKMTPQATDTEPGILRCYDNELFLQSIKEADANADFVIAIPHWGTEYSTVLETPQIEGAKAYIDAGADTVIGAHTHCLQGFDFYKDKPVAYSLGNFWFNEKTLYTMLLEVDITVTGGEITDYSMRVIPGIQRNCTTEMFDDVKDKEEVFSYLESISENVSINEEGIVEKITADK